MMRSCIFAYCIIASIAFCSTNVEIAYGSDYSLADNFDGNAPIYQLIALFQVSVQRGDAEMLATVCTPLNDSSASDLEVVRLAFESYLSDQSYVVGGPSSFGDFNLKIDSIVALDGQATAFIRGSWPISAEFEGGDRGARLSLMRISGRWQLAATEMLAMVDAYVSTCARLNDDEHNLKTEKQSRDIASIATAVQSDQLLNPVAFLDNPYIPRATLIYSQIYLNDQTLFGCPTSISSFKYVDSPYLSHDVVAVSDFCWRRIFVCDLSPDHSYFITKGQFGHSQSLDDFAQPCGMEFMGPGVLYVAEDVNNRIKVVNTNSASEEKLFLSKFIDIAEFNLPKDIDVSLPDENGERTAIVANSGNNNIIVFDDQEPWPAHNIRIHTGVGSSIGAFDKPTSVAFGRDPITSEKNHLAYFIDSDGKRIVRIGNWDVVPSIYISYSDFPTGTDLTSVGVDNKGEVWAVDNALSKIYKFTKDLDPIAKHGFFGTGDAEYSHPFSISFAQGYDNNTSQILSNLGEVLLSEEWSATTGVRRLVAGTEIFNSTINFRPRLLSGAPAVISGTYLTTGYANITTELLGPTGNVVESSQNLMWPSGAQNYSFSLTPSMFSGQYQVRINAASVYTNSNSDQVTLSIVIDNSITNQPPSEPNIWFPDGDSCFIMDEPKVIRAYSADPDGHVVSYNWAVTIPGSGEFYWTSGGEAMFVSHLHTGKIPDPSSNIRVTAVDNYGESSPYHQMNFSKLTVFNEYDCLLCTWQPGDPDFNHIITITDIVYITNYIFAGGPAPVPIMESGDADCNGIITISDALYLMNYIFGPGSPAVQCDCGDY